MTVFPAMVGEISKVLDRKVGQLLDAETYGKGNAHIGDLDPQGQIQGHRIVAVQLEPSKDIFSIRAASPERRPPRRRKELRTP